MGYDIKWGICERVRISRCLARSWSLDSEVDQDRDDDDDASASLSADAAGDNAKLRRGRGTNPPKLLNGPRAGKLADDIASCARSEYRAELRLGA